MARYIAVHNIPPDGGALAFAAGHQVPADIVERERWQERGWVTEVDDDDVSDRLDLVQPPPDNTPPTVTPGQRLLNEDFGDPQPDDSDLYLLVTDDSQPDEAGTDQPEEK